MEGEGIHAGHRERMFDKVVKSPESMPEHELLEVFLFPLIPRKDTNAIAHRLIRTFGNVSGVFSASAEELMAVEGIGKKAACELFAAGKIFREIMNAENKKKPINFSSFSRCKEALISAFGNLKEERFAVYLLNGKYDEITCIKYEDGARERVRGDITEIAKAIAIHKPSYIIIAHNHPSGNALPSETDDYATKKINALCALHGVSLADHIIVAKNDAYSYSVEKRMDYIKECSDPEKIMRNIEE